MWLLKKQQQQQQQQKRKHQPARISFLETGTPSFHAVSSTSTEVSAPSLCWPQDPSCASQRPHWAPVLPGGRMLQWQQHYHTGWIPGSGRSPGGGHGSTLQCSCLENPKDRGACWATVHRIAGWDMTEVT